MPSISVKSPNGGESWAAGSFQRIEWENFDVSNVDIEITRDSGANWDTIVANLAVTDSDEVYDWKAQAPLGNAIIRVSDSSNPGVFDVTDSAFEIVSPNTITDIAVLQPNGGETIDINSTYTIQWSSGSTIGANVKIEIAYDGGLFQTIVASTPNTGSYDWDVPLPESGSALIRISDAAAPAQFDVSDEPFRVLVPSTAEIIDLSVQSSIFEDGLANLEITFQDPAEGGPFPPDHTAIINWGDSREFLELDSEYVIVISVDGLAPATIQNLGESELPNLWKFREYGNITDNARSDYDSTVTLPNHVSMVTGMTIDTHQWTANNYTDGSGSIHNNHSGGDGFGSDAYVPSMFDVAHDAGLRTAIYVQKAKIADLFEDTWNDQGAPNANGSAKIDVVELIASGSAPGYDADVLTDRFLGDMTGSTNPPNNLSFLHYRAPDVEGEDHNFQTSTEYQDALRAIDTEIGRILNLVENNSNFRFRTSVILTSDHGGVSGSTSHTDPTNADNYTVPFYLFGHRASPQSDVYRTNLSNRTDPETDRVDHNGNSTDPIYNSNAANLALSLLGLDEIPNSDVNDGQDLTTGAYNFTYIPIDPVGTGPETFLVNHRYLDNPEVGDEFSIVVTIVDTNGGEVSGTLDIEVVNKKPVISSAVAVSAGDTGDTVLTLEFNDVGELDTFVVQVSWGDGVITQNAYDSDGIKTLLHSYRIVPNDMPPGARYKIKIVVVDDEGGKDKLAINNNVIFNLTAEDEAYIDNQANSTVQYNESAGSTAGVDTRFGNLIASYYKMYGDGEAGVDTEAKAKVDHSSVFVVTSDLKCNEIGNKRYESVINGE